MRYVFIAVGVIVAIVVVIAVIGWSLPVRHHASVARTYQASPTTLFGLITDVAAFPMWRDEVKKVETLPDENGRRRWRETTKNGPPITFVMEQAVPDRLLVGRIADTNLAFGGSWTYELAPEGGTTRLTITERGHVDNPVFRFFMIFHDNEKTMHQYIAALERKLHG